MANNCAGWVTSSRRSSSDGTRRVRFGRPNEIHRAGESNLYSLRSTPDIRLTSGVQFQEMKRLEREHAKEKQKLTKDKDAGACVGSFGLGRCAQRSSFDVWWAAKTQYNKASQAKAKLESLAREMQKENKKLRVRLFSFATSHYPYSTCTHRKTLDA